MGLIGCSETSVLNQRTSRDIPEDDRTELSVIPLSENVAVTGRINSGKGIGQGAKEIVGYFEEILCCFSRTEKIHQNYSQG